MPRCPKYDAVPGKTVCKYYYRDEEGKAHGLKDLSGSCTLTDEFMCVEWAKKHRAEVSPDGLVKVVKKPPRRH